MLMKQFIEPEPSVELLLFIHRLKSISGMSKRLRFCIMKSCPFLTKLLFLISICNHYRSDQTGLLTIYNKRNRMYDDHEEIFGDGKNSCIMVRIATIIHHIFQILHPATTFCFQTWKKS